MSPSKHTHKQRLDLYLDILKRAQKESDHALVQLIAKKIYKTMHPPTQTNDGCQVFSFPDLRTSAIVAESDAIDWRNGRVWRILFSIMVSFGFFTSWFLLFCQHFLPLKKW